MTAAAPAAATAASNPDAIAAALKGLYTAETSDECVDIADSLANLLVEADGLGGGGGVRAIIDNGVFDNLIAAAQNKKSGLAREGAMIGFAAIFKRLGAGAVPFFLRTIPVIFEAIADKGQVVRDAASVALKRFAKLPSPAAVRPHIIPLLDQHGLPSAKKWQTRVAALQMLSKMAERAPEQIGECLVELIPKITDCVNDTKPEVAKAGYECLTAICKVVNNNDLIPKIPILVSGITRPTQITDCIQKLSGTTFVAEVTGPALAILVPILVRALADRSQAVQRQTVIIIDNLCKLVRDPKDAGQFLPQLLPGLDKIIEMAAFPEVRALATAARNTLVKAGGAVTNIPEPVADEFKTSYVYTYLEKCVVDASGVFVDSLFASALEYAAPVCAEMITEDRVTVAEWKEFDVVDSILGNFITKAETQKAVKSFLDHYQKLLKKKSHIGEDDTPDGSVELCNCDFSLAYGGMMLLNHTNLTLRTGKRYGLCGANGAGKTTLMRAIAGGKVDGFPPYDVLKTVMVEHSLQGEDASLPIIDFVIADPKLSGATKDDVANALKQVGFTPTMQQSPVGSLSGGWKMKLELARAILMNADVLLLDEPTNHLDVENIKWLEDYLNSQTKVTSVIVSHDSSFLDNVCTHIIHYERKKLVYYKGNLSAFVKLRPEAKSYYTLTASQVKFSFPPPSILVGVRSNTKSILYMNNVTYTYPGASKKSLNNASVSVSLSSRVGIVGPNGAGKSTLIKCLLGEVIPQEGTVWKHPNLRVGYVAQHAFHHLEQHLDLTPNQYIQWRYAYGDDREVHEKATRLISSEEKAMMEKFIEHEGEKKQIEYILGRQKLKKSFRYEVKWVGKKHKFNSFLPRELLMDLGFAKLVQQFDDHESAREGLGYRELIPSVIRKHFEEVGLDGDIADHNLIGGLSGGQKVKVVIAACMWQNPHLLVLDEPTNFLDRDSLGGLAVAIRDWAGGVVMISHNEEFLTALCPEIWRVEAGNLTHQGKSEVKLANFEDQAAEAKKIDDRVRPKKKKLTRNQIKERDARRRERHLKWLIEGGPRPADTDSD
ncbi:P-loop containing nucleoside triphosphate hydrolase protein [Zopfochytrium polystomum]|nr:P-loop containing nucleoside triphosphate hydrolase protein [Zopfochytrium polystomum]